MKKQIVKTFAIFSLLFIAGMFQTVSAQDAPRVVVHVPFEFVAGKERLPAGSYTVGRVSRDSEKVLLIRSLGGDRTAAVMTHPANADGAQDVAQLAFNRYGDQYFLAQIRTPGTTTARELAPSKEEKRARRDLRQRVAARGQASGEDGEGQTVVITGSLR